MLSTGISKMAAALAMLKFKYLLPRMVNAQPVVKTARDRSVNPRYPKRFQGVQECQRRLQQKGVL